jgi:23S rRNA (cytosine1962-C5)-methyltransferase
MNRWIDPNLQAEFEAASTTTHRLYSSSEVWVERLGLDVLISHKNEVARDRAWAGLRAWETKSGFRRQRVFSRFLPKQNNDRVAPQLIEGDASLPLETVVLENGLSYGIDFAAGYAAGLFIDQRANRAHLRSLQPKRVLNTFAYTCSFSVAAAIAGAETLSIDLSKKSIERGKANFQLNQLPLDGHRFIADDVLDVLPRLAKRGEKFDAIILDPPTFSLGNKGRRWKVEEQMEDLLKAALELAQRHSSILISTNCTKLDRAALERSAKFALKLNRISGSFHCTSPLPDFPPGHGAQTLWLTLR